VIPLDKNSARKYGLEQRAKLDKNRKEKYDADLFSRMKEMAKQHTIIGVFVSLPKEVNTIPFIEWCFKNQKIVCVPKVKESTLTFHVIVSLKNLKEGSYHTLEPKDENEISVDEMEILFVPLSSFDRNFNRTGYGKGYYDSVLKKAKYTVGLAYPEQEVELIETESFDVALDTILIAKK